MLHIAYTWSMLNSKLLIGTEPKLYQLKANENVKTKKSNHPALTWLGLIGADFWLPAIENGYFQQIMIIYSMHVGYASVTLLAAAVASSILIEFINGIWINQYQYIYIWHGILLS